MSSRPESPKLVEGPEKSFLWDPKSLKDDVFIKAPPAVKERTNHPHAYASFGDNGLTASINEYGHIMQISRYVGFGLSGFLCVDSQYPEPFEAQNRMEELMKKSKEPDHGLRLNLVNWTEDLEKPSLGFMYDRWPRYVFRRKSPVKSKQVDESLNDSEGDHLSEQPQGDVKTDSKSFQDTSKDTHGPSKETTEIDENPPLSVQYFCHGDTVIQKYLIRSKASGGIPHDTIDSFYMTLASSICIRGLDFNVRHKFNADFDDSMYDSKVISNNHLVIKHDMRKKAANNLNQTTLAADDFSKSPVAAVLVVSPFIRGRPAKIINDSNIDVTFEGGETELEVTVAYTLKLLYPDALDWPEISDEPKSKKRSAMFAATCGYEVTEAMEQMNSALSADFPFFRLCFAKSPHLDFAFRRNLEHILSVCSVPVAERQAPALPLANQITTVIAITCGDISGHRVSSRASLSAFQFLCSVASYVDPENEHDLLWEYVMGDGDPKTQANKAWKTKNEQVAVQSAEQEKYDSAKKKGKQYLLRLHKRIYKVLGGHILWILTQAAFTEIESPMSAQPKTGVFASHYWPTGQAIEDTGILSPPALVDTPLQLLKIVQYKRLLGGSCFESLQGQDVQKKLHTRVHLWLEKLHQLNERGTYAFSVKSSLDDEDQQRLKYRLTDHVMIGLAIECVDRAVLSDSSPSLRHYEDKEVREKILKRFTTEHPISKQRTLATGRWVNETRYLLHSKDTFLFTAANMGYFANSWPASGLENDKQNTKSVDHWKYADERWTMLLDSQAYQDEYQCLEWNKPLWYAVVMVLACKGKMVNVQSTEAVIAEVGNVLLRHTWYNGLFPGLFGLRHTPALHQDEQERDAYWFTTFEVANVFWDMDTAGQISTRLDRPEEDSSSIGNMRKRVQKVSKTRQQVGKHAVFVNLNGPNTPISRFVLSDDWLQPMPSLLEFGSRSSTGLEDSIPDLYKQGEEKSNPCDKFPIFEYGAHRCSIVIDIPRNGVGAELSKVPLNDHAQNCLETIDLTQRTVWDSKKRILWLSDPTKEVVKKVFQGCSSTEQDCLRSFFARHTKPESFFLDYPNAASNEWETELHLTFFTISQSPEHALWDLDVGNQIRRIKYRTMSFRFSGDFTDRFWTCYFLESAVDENTVQDMRERLHPGIEHGIRSTLGLWNKDAQLSKPSQAVKQYKKHWQQRRVLELLIFNDMLRNLLESTHRTFKEIKRQLLEPGKGMTRQRQSGRDGLFAQPVEEAVWLQVLGQDDNYDNLTQRWRMGAPIITVLVTNLEENITKIREWTQREDDRQGREPRWTSRDMQKYDATIQRLRSLSSRQINRVESMKTNIQAFNDSLPDQLTRMQSDLDFRGSQNINLFTYVTVVFLPLGFATGILSMSGLPDQSLLMNLVFLSLGSLGVTLFALLNAKAAKPGISKMAKAYRKLVLVVIFKQIRFMWQIVKYVYFHSIGKLTIQTGAHAQEQPRGRTLRQIASQMRSWWYEWTEIYEDYMNFTYSDSVEQTRAQVV